MSNSKIDPAGTTPGIQVSGKPEPKKLGMKCRFEGCTGMQVVEVPLANGQSDGAPSNRVYQCTTCQGTWGLPVGGNFPF